MSRLPSWLVGVAAPVPRESTAIVRRRRKVVTAVSVAGAGLLGASLSTKPDSRQFYALTLGVAGTWLVGGAGSGPLHLGWEKTAGQTPRRPVILPTALGVGAFGVFYAAAHVARHVPVLNRALTAVLQYADQGSNGLVLTTTLANGLGEEVFFRGALFAALGGSRAVPASTAVYVLATTATRNPALVLASGVMGTLFGLQRRATGGIQAPILTHLTWSALMLRYLPPLFPPPARDALPTSVPPPATVPPATTAE